MFGRNGVIHFCLGGGCRETVSIFLFIISMFAVAALLQVLIFFAKLRHRKERQASLGAMRRKIDGSLPQIKIWVFRQFFRALLALPFPLMPSCFARQLSTCKKSVDKYVLELMATQEGENNDR